MQKSKNKEWKESGSDLSFKEWLRQDLNNTVQSAVKKNNEYSNLTGVNPACNYQPCVTGSVLGINQYVIISGVLIVFTAIAVGIWYKAKKSKK